jgi:hypothetical protein
MEFSPMKRVFRVGLCLFAASYVAAAQQPEADTRAAQIEAERQKKAAALKPEVVTPGEHRLLMVREKRILEKITYGVGGLRARIGALVTGSGFAVGPEYFRDDLANGNVVFRATTQFSTQRFQLYDVALAFPRLMNEHAFLDLHATHRNFPQMQYYGPGPDSQRTGRSNYRLEDTNYSFNLGVRPVRPFRLGVTGGFTEVNVGPGTRRQWISTERIYSPAQAPGIDHQTDFLQGGVFAQFDYRDFPGAARKGGNYLARYTYNKDVDLRRHTFRRLELEAQQFIPFLNERRVIALRARSELTYKNAGQVVPFYMQPVLGGSNDLRGSTRGIARSCVSMQGSVTKDFRYGSSSTTCSSRGRPSGAGRAGHTGKEVLFGRSALADAEANGRAGQAEQSQAVRPLRLLLHDLRPTGGEAA